MINSTNLTFIQNFTGEQVGPPAHPSLSQGCTSWIFNEGLVNPSVFSVPQMASYFGYSVAVTDLNGDG